MYQTTDVPMSDYDLKTLVELCHVYKSYKKRMQWLAQQKERSREGRLRVRQGLKLSKEGQPKLERLLGRERIQQNKLKAASQLEANLDMYQAIPITHQTKHWRDYTTMDLIHYQPGESTIPTGKHGSYLVPKPDIIDRDVPLSNIIMAEGPDFTPNDCYVTSSGVDFGKFFSLASLFNPTIVAVFGPQTPFDLDIVAGDVIKPRGERSLPRLRSPRKRCVRRIKLSKSNKELDTSQMFGEDLWDY